MELEMGFEELKEHSTAIKRMTSKYLFSESDGQVRMVLYYIESEDNNACKVVRQLLTQVFCSSEPCFDNPDRPILYSDMGTQIFKQWIYNLMFFFNILGSSSFFNIIDYSINQLNFRIEEKIHDVTVHVRATSSKLSC